MNTSCTKPSQGTRSHTHTWRTTHPVFHVNITAAAGSPPSTPDPVVAVVGDTNVAAVMTIIVIVVIVVVRVSIVCEHVREKKEAMLC